MPTRPLRLRLLELTGYRFKNKPEINDQEIKGNQDPKYMMEQLKQCWEDWRHYNSTIWQMPSLTIAIVGGLVGVSYYAVSEPLPRAALITLAACFSFSMIITLIKHRFFHDVRTCVIEYMSEKQGIKNFSPIRGRIPQSKPILRAYSFLLFSMQALFVVTAILAIMSFINAL